MARRRLATAVLAGFGRTMTTTIVVAFCHVFRHSRESAGLSGENCAARFAVH
jgi:hypothetical protein